MSQTQHAIPKPLEATFLRVQEEAPGVKSFLFKYDKAHFNYKSGQSLLLFPSKDDPSIRHPLSIASAPSEDFLMISTKIRHESPFKTRLDTLKPGDTVSIMGPGGNHFTLPEQGDNQIVFLGGGIGITPFRSMIKHATDNQLPFKITLLYSNRAPEDIVYKKDWKEFQEKNPNLTVVQTITRPEESNEEWKGRTGKIDANLIREYTTDLKKAIFYICGPPRLIADLSGTLTEMGVNPEQIRMENFRGYTD